MYIIGSKLGIRLQLHIEIQMHTHTHTHIVSQEIYLSNNTNFLKNIILSFFCCVYNFGLNFVSLAQNVKNLPAMWDTWVWSLSQEDPLEEGKATHSRILAWRIPMDRGAWQATVYGVTKSRTGLNISKHAQMLEFSWAYAFWRRRQWHPTPVLLPGKSHGQRSLVGCSPWGRWVRTWLSDFTFTFPFHALEKAMATHSSVLAWRIPGTGEPGGLPCLGSHRVGHDWSDLAAACFVKTVLKWTYV